MFEFISCAFESHLFRVLVILKHFVTKYLKGLNYKIDKMTWALTLFIIGLIGFILNRKNVILMLVSIEIMLLAVTLIILINSIAFNDNLGQLFALFVIALAGAESAIGLSILVVYYKLTGAVSLTKNIDVESYKS